MMNYAKSGLFAALVVTGAMFSTGAQALCSHAWADVTSACPSPGPYAGATYSAGQRAVPVTGTTAVSTNSTWGNGYTIRYVKGTSREAGRQQIYDR